MTLYSQVNSRRKEWEPICPTAIETAVEGAEDTISRGLALRKLELPVKEFILEGISRPETKSLGEEAISSLMRNTEDEEKHDTALNNCTVVYRDYNPKDEVIVDQILDAWKTHPDHPITKTAVLENGVFFVLLPLYRQFGGSALRMTSMDISADEINHVQIHRYVSKKLGQRPSKSLDDLRKATIAWLVANFSVVGYSKDKFVKASDDLMYRGITDELEFTKTSTVPAFFERRNSTLPYYS